MFNVFKKMSFAMIVPNQKDEALYALGKDLVKLGARTVRCVDEKLVDQANNPVYDAVAVIVEDMPVRHAMTFLTRFNKTLVKTQKYTKFGKTFDMYV